MKNILFICHGNICRSPVAEFVMKDLVKKAGLASQFHIESAATSREEIGNPVYPPVRRKLSEHGISCDGHAARQLTNQDYDKYDLLIGMDSANLRNMHRICGGDFAANFVVFSRRNLENLQWYSMTHGGNRKVAAFVVFGIL